MIYDPGPSKVQCGFLHLKGPIETIPCRLNGLFLNVGRFSSKNKLFTEVLTATFDHHPVTTISTISIRITISIKMYKICM
jgi:hypothetical protein